MEQQENTPLLQEYRWAEYALKACCRSGPKHHKQRFCRKCKALPLRGTAKARFTYAVGSSAGNTNRTILPGVCDCHFNLCRKPLLFPVSQNHKFSELVKARASCSLTSFRRLPVFQTAGFLEQSDTAFELGRSQENLHACILVDLAPGQGCRGMVNACKGVQLNANLPEDWWNNLFVCAMWAAWQLWNTSET